MMKSSLWYFLLSLLCTLPLRVDAWWGWTPVDESKPVVPDPETDVVLPDDIGLLVVSNTPNPDAFCTPEEYLHVDERLLAGVFDVLFYDDNTDDRRELSRSRQLDVNCRQDCRSFKEGHCWLVYPKCKGYRERNLRGQNMEEREQGLKEGAERNRALWSLSSLWKTVQKKEGNGEDYDFESNWSHMSGRWRAWIKKNPGAEEQCLREKRKLEFALMALKWDGKLEMPCKLLLKDISVGCVKMTGRDNSDD